MKNANVKTLIVKNKSDINSRPHNLLWNSLSGLEMTEFSYSDITLLPRQISTVDSRDDVDTSSYFAGSKLTLPLLAAPMPDVCDGKMAGLLADYGAYGFIHRFNSIEEQVNEYRIAGKRGGCAVGVKGDFLERFQALYHEGCRSFCIDTANGANLNVKKALEQLKKTSDYVYFTMGNVCTKEAVEWLHDLGVYAFRCGIAGGTGCSTRTETGIFRPTASSTLECSGVKNRVKKSDEEGRYEGSYLNLIADGSVKLPQDMCKALALGADFVMVGGLLAGCTESPATLETPKYWGKINPYNKIFRGAASAEVQKMASKTPKYIEGVETVINHTGPLIDTLRRFENGLRSSMSYVNANNLKEYRENVKWAFLKS